MLRYLQLPRHNPPSPVSPPDLICEEDCHGLDVSVVPAPPEDPLPRGSIIRLSRPVIRGQYFAQDVEENIRFHQKIKFVSSLCKS